MKQYFILMMLAFLIFACNKEEALIPTERPEFGYSVPQGDHEYDERIVDWKNRFNTFILYKFDLKELFWQINDWIESVPDETGTYEYTNGILGQIADEAYVGEQLDMVENLFLNFYPDTTLYRCLPLKLLLCSKLEHRTTDGSINTVYNAYSGYDYIAFNWGNAQILTLTTVQKNEFKNESNYTFLKRLLDNGKIVEDAAFYEGMNYEDRVTAANMYGRGFIKPNTKQEDDVENYIQAIISTPYADLIAEPADGDNTNIGILHSKKDVNGHIRRKYDNLVNKFKKNYGIDLQAIGNYVIQ